MNLHQVLTGAVNPGDHCFSVGSVGDQRFTVSKGGSCFARGWSASLSRPGSAQQDRQRPGTHRRPTGVPRPSQRSPPPRAGRTLPLRGTEAETFRSLSYLTVQSLNSEVRMFCRIFEVFSVRSLGWGGLPKSFKQKSLLCNLCVGLGG